MPPVVPPMPSPSSRPRNIRDWIAKATIFIVWLIISTILYVAIVYRQPVPRHRQVLAMVHGSSTFSSKRSAAAAAELRRNSPPPHPPTPAPNASSTIAGDTAAASIGIPAPEPYLSFTGLKRYWSGVQFAPVHRTRHFVLWAISISPYLLTLWIFALLTFKVQRVKLNLVLPAGFFLPKQFDETEIQEQIKKEWSSEQLGTVRALERGNDYAHFLGGLASAILSACALIYAYYYKVGLTFRSQHGEKLAVTLWVATAVAFGLALGRIVMRLSNSDASPRMFAAATRTLISAAISAFFLSALFDFTGETKLSVSAVGCAVLGAAIAVIGNRMLDYITGRAETLLKVAARPALSPADLQLIDGLLEDDAERLAEEGVDSVHALAFFPTARLFLNTVYGLQRICDWQDQAFLNVYLGKEKAQAFRNQLAVRGATDVQRLVELLLPRLGPDTNDKLYTLLGFTDADLCRTALLNIGANRLLAQLQVLKAAIVEKIQLV